MKKILFLLLCTVSIYGQTYQNPTFGKVKIKSNTTDNTATKVVVQSTDGSQNTILKTDLQDVISVASAINLPVTGVAGKFYYTQDDKKYYNWNGTIYEPISSGGKEDVANKQNSLAIDGTGVKYPTVDAVNALKWIKSNESLALTQRKGDVLYGILDQYTGEEMTLSKVTGAPAVDGIIYFQLGAEYFKRNYKSINLKWFGVTEDGTTDDYSALNIALTKITTLGKATVDILGDINLNGNNITIPSNIILEFKGGRIINHGIITGTETIIKAGSVAIFDLTGSFSGTWRVPTTQIMWFGAVGKNGIDQYQIFNYVLANVNFGGDLLINETNEVYLLDGGYVSVPSTCAFKRIYSTGLTKIKINWIYGGGGIKIGNGTFASIPIVFENLYFTGNNALVDNILVEDLNASHIEFLNCTFEGAGGVGFLFDAADVKFTNVNFINCGTGFKNDSSTLRGSGLTFENCHFQGNDNGFEINNFGVDKIRFQSCIFQGNGIALKLDVDTNPSHLINLDDCYFEDNSGGNIQTGGGTAVPNIRNLSIENSHFIESYAVDSQIRKVDTFSLINNYFGSQVDVNYGCINTDSSVTNLSIKDNRFEGRVTPHFNSTIGVYQNNSTAGLSTVVNQLKVIGLSGTTAQRPVSTTIGIGTEYYDTDIAGLIFWNGNTWSILAPLDSPSLTGTPTAPTATVGTNTTQIATTAFVKENIDTSVHWTKTGNEIRNNNSGKVKIGADYGYGFGGALEVSKGDKNVGIATNGRVAAEEGFVLSDQSSGMGWGNNAVTFTSYAGNGFRFHPIYLNATAHLIQANADIVSFSNALINPTSGSVNFNMYNISPTVNQTGGANGITRSIYINPTLTSAADFRAIEVTAGKTILQEVELQKPIKLKGYTVATLPTGTQGDTAYVTDLLAPTYMATAVGGGSVVWKVFYDGTSWKVD